VTSASANGFGTWLRRNRELRDLSLDAVIAETKLPPRVVNALEQDDTSVMPDRSYALQYVRSVSLAVGLDPEDAALRYEEWLQLLPPATLPPPPQVPSNPMEKAMQPLGKLARLPQRISRDPMVWVILLCTVGAAALLLLKR
jgi:cytoskeletal protein RodZ